MYLGDLDGAYFSVFFNLEYDGSIGRIVQCDGLDRISGINPFDSFGVGPRRRSSGDAHPGWESIGDLYFEADAGVASGTVEFVAPARATQPTVAITTSAGETQEIAGTIRPFSITVVPNE